MKYDVTRDVVSDLWPVCQSGEASADTRALVDAYLAQDADFAGRLKASRDLRSVMPPVRLPPDAELRLLQAAQRNARTKLLIIGGAVAVGGLLALISLVALILLRTAGINGLAGRF
jgi:ferric-dicitrate binding protein FerR (iron transport regulator)